MATTIRIAQDVHPRHEEEEDDDASCHTNDSEAEPHHGFRKPAMSSHDDGIYNIRARGPSHDNKSFHRANAMHSTDEDPGLRREEDYKQSQVRHFSHGTASLLIRVGVQREDASLASISEYGYHLRRYRDQSPIRLFVYFHIGPFTPRPDRSSVDYYLVSDNDGDSQVCADHSSRRQ